MSELDPGMMPVKVGGKEYPVKHDINCKVCTSPYRLDMERALVAGYSYKKILDSLPEDEDTKKINTNNLKNHIERLHVPLPEFQKRALIERRAEQIGKSIEEGQEMLVDYAGVNEMLIQHGFEALQEGTIRLKANDLISALKFQHEIEQSQQGNLDDEAWAEALMEYLRIAKALMPEELWNAFGQELQSSHILQAIAQKMNGEREPEVREIED